MMSMPIPGARHRKEMRTENAQIVHSREVCAQQSSHFQNNLDKSHSDLDDDCCDDITSNNVDDSRQIKAKKSGIKKFSTLIRKKMKKTFHNSTSKVKKNGDATSNGHTSKETCNNSSKSASTGALGGGNIENGVYKPSDSEITSEYTPCLLGLKNHGNTCFLNCVVQCLSNTDSLAQYIIADLYKSDKNPKSRCEVTEEFSNVLRSLWLGDYVPNVSKKFKEVISSNAQQYEGYSQHDCQEFLLWLLDQIHEDLCVLINTPKLSKKATNEDQRASQSLANHNGSSSSFIYNFFQGLFRSSLTCPNCRKDSTTFDPFLCVELPIPQPKTRPIYITLVYCDIYPKQCCVGLEVRVDSTVADLRGYLTQETHIPSDQLLLCDMKDDGFHKSYYNDQLLTDISDATGSLHAIELPHVDRTRFESNDILVVATNTAVTAKDSRRFGSPYVFYIPRESSYSHLQETVLNCFSEHLRDPSIISEVRRSSSLKSLFSIRVVHGISGQCYLPKDLDLPLYVESVDKALSSNGAKIPHLKLVVEWEKQVKNNMFYKSDYDEVQEHHTVRDVSDKFKDSVTSTLEQCFQQFTRAEELGEDDAWNCPGCKRLQKEAVKLLKIWSLPDVLVVHLKRFKQVGHKRIHNTKLNMLIDFPLTDLDLTEYLDEKNKRSCSSNDNCYDLYAVCNHYGTMSGGHYTAFCKNPVNDRWYSYDDMTVREINPKDVVTKAAYLLFYQKSSLLPKKNGDYHWIYDMPAVKEIIEKKWKQKSPIQSDREATWSDETSPTSDTSANITTANTKTYEQRSPTSPDPNIVRSVVASTGTSLQDASSRKNKPYNPNRYSDSSCMSHNSSNGSRHSEQYDNQYEQNWDDGLLQVTIPEYRSDQRSEQERWSQPRYESDRRTFSENADYSESEKRKAKSLSPNVKTVYNSSSSGWDGNVLHNTTWDGEVSHVRQSSQTALQDMQQRQTSRDKATRKTPAPQPIKEQTLHSHEIPSQIYSYEKPPKPYPHGKQSKNDIYNNTPSEYTNGEKTSVKDRISSFECQRRTNVSHSIQQPAQTNAQSSRDRYTTENPQYYISHSKNVSFPKQQTVHRPTKSKKAPSSVNPYMNDISNHRNTTTTTSYNVGGIGHRKQYREVLSESSV